MPINILKQTKNAIKATGKPIFVHNLKSDGVAEYSINIKGKQVLGLDNDTQSPYSAEPGTMPLWIGFGYKGVDSYQEVVSKKDLANALMDLAKALLKD